MSSMCGVRCGDFVVVGLMIVEIFYIICDEL